MKFVPPSSVPNSHTKLVMGKCIILSVMSTCMQKKTVTFPWNWSFPQVCKSENTNNMVAAQKAFHHLLKVNQDDKKRWGNCAIKTTFCWLYTGKKLLKEAWLLVVLEWSLISDNFCLCPFFFNSSGFFGNGQSSPWSHSHFNEDRSIWRNVLVWVHVGSSVSKLSF